MTKYEQKVIDVANKMWIAHYPDNKGSLYVLQSVYMEAAQIAIGLAASEIIRYHNHRNKKNRNKNFNQNTVLNYLLSIGLIKDIINTAQDDNNK